MFYWSLWTRSQTFTALVSKWCWQVLLADPQSGGEQPGNSAPKFSETCSVEYISWVRSCLLSKWSHNWWFRWKLWQSNVFSLQIMAMLTWNEMPCVENLQITYCVHCRNTNTLGYRCQRSVFCDCYRNMGHFLCSVERIKRFVNVHLHCIVSNVTSECANTQDNQNCCAVKSHSRALATIQSNGNSTENKELFQWNVYFVRILIRLYIYYIIKNCNSLKTLLTQP